MDSKNSIKTPDFKKSTNTRRFTFLKSLDRSNEEINMKIIARGNKHAEGGKKKCSVDERSEVPKNDAKCRGGARGSNAGGKGRTRGHVAGKSSTTNTMGWGGGVFCAAFCFSVSARGAQQNTMNSEQEYNNKELCENPFGETPCSAWRNYKAATASKVPCCERLEMVGGKKK